MKSNVSRPAHKVAKVSFGVAACLAVTATAFALTTINLVNGMGFVGKGDLQTPWGWNDQKLQASASSVSFFYDSVSSDTYSAVCEFTTGEGTRGERIHDVTHVTEISKSINSTVAYDTRKNSQNKVTGFNLTGYSGEAITVDSGAPVPVVGGPCPGNPGTDGTWVSVTPTSSSSIGGLYASSTVGPQGPTLIWDAVTGSVHP